VLIFLFAKGSTVDPKKWPCPAAGALDAITGCEKRFWSNGKARRDTQFENHRRRFGRTVDPAQRELKTPKPELLELGSDEKTFACRFYHGLAVHSPCERDVKMWVLQLKVDAPTPLTPGSGAQGGKKVPLANRRFVAKLGDAVDSPVIRGTTSDSGTIALPLFDPEVLIILKVDAFAALAPPPPPKPEDQPIDSEAAVDEDQFVTLRLKAGTLKRLQARDANSLNFDPSFDPDRPPPDDAEVRLGTLERLYNLGYGKDDTGGDTFGNWSNDERREFLKQFQRDQNPPLTASGTLDTPTRQALFKEHGG
ncbi:MAG: hypothetical protein ABI647_24215, partial [Gemmatimonadota bacterium]